MIIDKKSILMGIVGSFIIIVSTIRWYFIWYDPSQAGLGIGLGSFLIFSAYIYNWKKGIGNVVEEISKKVGFFSKVIMEKEE